MILNSSKIDERKNFYPVIRQIDEIRKQTPSTNWSIPTTKTKNKMDMGFQSTAISVISICEMPFRKKCEVR